jgi:Rrf2 family protein
MLRLSKKVEYALLALQYMSQHEDNVCSVKEMAERFNISFELLAKVLSTLSKSEIVQSIQGVRGGFTLRRPARLVSIKDVVDAIEHDRATLVECSGDDNCGCYAEENCTIKHPLMRLQTMIDNTLDSMTVEDLSEPKTRLVELELV